MNMSPSSALSRRSIIKGGLGAGALALGAGLLSGCGQGEEPTESKTLAATSSPSAALAGELTIWNRSGDLYKVFDAAIKKFTAANPKVTVKHLALDIDAKLSNTLVSGAGVPDGCFLDDAKVAGLAEHLYDLTPLIEPVRKDISPYKMSTNTVNGKVFGIPWDLDPGLLFYRVDVLEKAGVDPASLTSYDALLQAGDAIRTKTGSKGPIHLEKSPFLGQLQLEMFANQSGTSMTDNQGKLRLESEEYTRILTWIKQVSDQKLGSHTEYTGPEDLKLLDDGTQALVPWAMWFTYPTEQLLKASKGKWRAAALPKWTPDGAVSGAMGGSSFIIPAKAKNPELAWHLYRYLCLTTEGAKALYSPNDLYPGGLNTSVPSFVPAADPATPLFSKVAGLGGQDLWKTAAEAGKTIPESAPIPSWWGKSVDYLGNNVQRLIEGKMSVEQVLADSSKKIQNNLIRRS